MFRTIVPAAASALLITSAALPTAAQNSVPASAVQAARTPQFAARLAHPGQQSASRPNPAQARQQSRRRAPQGDGIYNNGPINGSVDAWTINSGFVVSNTITIPTAGGILQDMNFGAWVFPGDVLQSVEISITSSEFGGTIYFDGVVGFTQTGCSSNQFGFNICTATSANFSGPNLAAGTYWVNLSNAVVNDGDPIYWDENSGIGCDSPGCPSEASENSVGTIPSESFTILGMNTCFPLEQKPAPEAKAVTAPPSPTLNYRVIYNFTGNGDGGVPDQSLAVDAAGNLYGTTSVGGPLGGGTAFKLSPRASGWLFNRLYTFALNGSFSSPLVLAPDGTLFGTTSTGGDQHFGAIASLSPPGHVLGSVFSNWTENLLYSFFGVDDGANPGGSLVLDSSGNIYGTAKTAGANRDGALYEFTHGTLQVLHAFPAFGGDGAFPLGVVSGTNGLYGITGLGGGNGGGTLYTTAGGYQVLFSFGPYQLSGGPTSLAADQMGNLFGSDTFQNCFADGTNVSEFSPPDFTQSILATIPLDYQGAISSWVSTDSLGNVYGTSDIGGPFSDGNAFKLTCCWTFTDLHDFSGGPSDGANPASSPVVDAQGNIYGTTSQGGAYGYGVVWEISP
ncbi:MAG TPA: choice-of-anchor tandem repeat GloVer-containing protein [Bryocella sp.]|nr:choice-of-anchor tandem repeat GloVer-containing protein [Bryocella sp.]